MKINNATGGSGTQRLSPYRECSASTGSAAGLPKETAVRKIHCRTILNRTDLSDYSLNCYLGCTHGCIYCYARFMQRFHSHPEPWGGFVDIKVNAVDILARQLRRAKPGAVFISSACDGWQPSEKKWKLTRQCCSLLLAHGFRLHILTKNALILRDLDLFKGHNVRIGVTLTTMDERLRRFWEPHGSSVQERFKIIEKAREAGLETAVMFGPLLPLLSDSQASMNDLFRFAADFEVDTVWVDALNPRPRVWPAVASLLRREFPDLLDCYRRILYERRTREDYLLKLRDRIARCAGRYSITDRVVACF